MIVNDYINTIDLLFLIYIDYLFVQINFSKKKFINYS